jgi:hypothetical protein
MAHDLEKDYGDIKQSVKGVIFMGTPHLGAGIASASRFLRDIANVITVRGIRRDLLKALEPKSQELTDISRRFVHRTLSLQILSMYEQNRTKNILVSSTSQRFLLAYTKAAE